MANFYESLEPTPPRPFHRFIEKYAVTSPGAGSDIIYISPIVAPIGATQLSLWAFAQTTGGAAVTSHLYVEMLDHTNGSYGPYSPEVLVQIPGSPPTDFHTFATNDTSTTPVVLVGPPPFFRLRVEVQSGGGTADLSVFGRFEGHFGVRG